MNIERVEELILEVKKLELSAIESLNVCLPDDAVERKSLLAIWQDILSILNEKADRLRADATPGLSAATVQTLRAKFPYLDVVRLEIHFFKGAKKEPGQ